MSFIDEYLKQNKDTVLVQIFEIAKSQIEEENKKGKYKTVKSLSQLNLPLKGERKCLD